MKRISKNSHISIHPFLTHARAKSRCFSQLYGIMTPDGDNYPSLSLHDPTEPIPGTIKKKSFFSLYEIVELPKQTADREGSPTLPATGGGTVRSKQVKEPEKKEKEREDEESVYDGNMMVCRDIASSKRWAVRRLVKEKKNVHKPEDLSIILSISHTNILKIREIFESKEAFYVVSELAVGLEVIDSIITADYYTEFQAIDIMTQVLCGLEYLHDRGIAHMKLEPSNVLLRSNESDSRIMLGDFGVSSLIGSNVQSKCFTACTGFCAPEVLRLTKPSIPADIWSAGILAYTILSGDEPFYSDEVSDVYKKILKADVTYSTKSWDILSFNAKDMVRSMLVTEPGERPRAFDLLKHSWFTGQASRNVNLYVTIKNLRAYQERNKKCHWRSEQFGRIRMMGDELKVPIEDPFEFTEGPLPPSRTDAEQGKLESHSVDQDLFLLQLLNVKKD